ncbi:hypothetical protein [Limisphaera sp. 4302-co]|uniref:hypothetical protein n=1 Tax=Limisphaera sp. 4302-co TaxID=3400417 RepID=UPI003C26608B
MRTKALLAAAAFAAGLAASMAQNVYSLNVVGYYNITIPPNSFALIANQLNTTNNTLGSLIPSAPDGTQFFKFSGTGWDTYTYDELEGGWLPNGNVSLNPGEGGFVRNNTANALTITFVGEVLQGSLTNPVPAGFSVRSSMVPQAGTLTQLAFPAADGDQVFVYRGGSYVGATYDELEQGWLPAEPNLGVGEAFFSRKSAPATWVRNFTVQ